MGDDGWRQLERALGAELTDHMGYEKADSSGRDSGNRRNGHSDKTVPTDEGEVPIVVPRDRPLDGAHHRGTGSSGSGPRCLGYESRDGNHSTVRTASHTAVGRNFPSKAWQTHCEDLHTNANRGIAGDLTTARAISGTTAGQTARR